MQSSSNNSEIQEFEKTRPRMIVQAKRRRAGKKSHITRKINEINELIHNRGSRTKVSFLQESMKKKLQEAIVMHEELMVLLKEDDEDFNDVWIEDLAANVDTCSANINNYLTLRQNDPESSKHSSSRGSRSSSSKSDSYGQQEYVTKNDIDLWRKQVNDSQSEQSVESTTSLFGEQENSAIMKTSYYEKPETELVETFSRFHITLRGSDSDNVVHGIKNNDKRFCTETNSAYEVPTRGKNINLKRSSSVPVLPEQTLRLFNQAEVSHKIVESRDQRIVLDGGNQQEGSHPDMETKGTSRDPIWKDIHSYQKNDESRRIPDSQINLYPETKYSTFIKDKRCENDVRETNEHQYVDTTHGFGRPLNTGEQHLLANLSYLDPGVSNSTFIKERVHFNEFETNEGVQINKFNETRKEERVNVDPGSTKLKNRSHYRLMDDQKGNAVKRTRVRTDTKPFQHLPEENTRYNTCHPYGSNEVVYNSSNDLYPEYIQIQPHALEKVNQPDMETTAIENDRGQNVMNEERPSDSINDYQVARLTPADQWIDELDLAKPDKFTYKSTSDIPMQILIQQGLPKITIETFDGSPEVWISFVEKFHDMVHNIPYLTIIQKKAYLLQHLKGEPLKAINGFGNDRKGYIMSLKRLKYMFGNHALVAQATIKRLTKGKQIADDDVSGLAEFYYSLSQCLTTLQKMQYDSDIQSTDVLRQALRRLPRRILRKWAEYSFILRRKEEPTLIHLEHWLQDRIMAAKDPYLPADTVQSQRPCKHKSEKSQLTSLLTTHPQSNKEYSKCTYCKKNHSLYRCSEFKSKSAMEKLKFVKRNKLCFNCLQAHNVKSCPSSNTCFSNGCSKKHHTSLHDAFHKKDNNVKEKRETIKKNQNVSENENKIEQNKNKNKKKEEEKDKDNKNPSKSKTHCGVTTNGRRVYLRVVPVKISNDDGKSIITYGLLDGGSHCTMVRQDVVRKLQLLGQKEPLNIGTITDPGSSIMTKSVSLNLSSQDESFKVTITNVLAVENENFNVPSQKLPKNYKKSKHWNYIKNLDIRDVSHEDIAILVGADVPSAIIATEVKHGGSGFPLATKTPFGWALIGVHENSNERVKSLKVCHARLNSDEHLNQFVENFWTTENFGTEVNDTTSRSVNDKLVLKMLEEETELVDGHYVVPKLWKKETNMYNNYTVARRRFEYLEKKFRKDESYFEMYSKQITDYVDKGYARKLSKEEIKRTTGKTNYVPHHGVINPNKPGKLRVVFDAAAKFNGFSLNDNLITGPDLLNNLVGVILRFRKFPVVIIGDIEAMYSQVRLKKEDRDAVRFLWKETRDSRSPDHFQMLVHIFGATDSPCCACFALRKTAIDNKEEFPEEIVQCVMRDFYMDDFIKSVESEQDAASILTDLTNMLKKGGFKLTKFNSNSDVVIGSIRPEELARSKIQLDLDDRCIQRTLGVKWNLNSDKFTFSSTLSAEIKYTKRGILKITSSVYDPLGFLAPFILKAKLLIQELWRQKYDWDEEVPEKIRKQWKNWIDELLYINTLEIPRCFDLTGASNIQLHIFCDASELAFAAVGYVRVQHEDNITCNLIMAKSRLAPLKRLTLPRLELQGAVLGVRLKKFIIQEMDTEFDSINFWTDSTIILQYIQNEERRFKVFVSNRVSEIRRHSEVPQWRHVEGIRNPADLPTRGMTLKELKETPSWFFGPDFLYKDENEWPISEIQNSIDPDDEELKVDTSHSKMVLQTIRKIETVIQYERFSKWTRLVHTIVYVKRFLARFRIRSEFAKNRYTITTEDFMDARNSLINLVQSEVFHQEINELRDNGCLKAKNELAKLDPFIGDDGLLRVGGRLKHALIPYASKHQIILPSSHHVTMLLIRHIHVRNLHCGKEHLMSILRQEYWIIKCRKTVKNVLRKCMICKKLRPKLMSTKMADLPRERLAISSPPFTNTGTDYFGPITVRMFRKKLKRWGCLFTCLTTRAIHLEVAESLDTDAFINALERFSNRRGYPLTIRSDCGSNFKGAEKELREELQKLNQERIQEYACRKQLTWIFNPPEAPHMGGSWERLVRSVKISLKVIMSDCNLDDFGLQTVFTEIEGFINSRPLSMVSDDVNDLSPLTPNHFLIGRANANFRPCETTEKDLNHKRRWKRVQAVTDSFWKRWRKEYLPNLTSRSKWTVETAPVKKGDLVLLTESSWNRGVWQLARITNVMPGKDGIIRVVELKTKSGIYTRPLTKIAKLDFDSC